MMIKGSDYEKIYKALTKEYLKYAVRYLDDFNIHQLRELMRVSLCEALCLDTKDNCLVDLIPYKTDLRRIYIPILNQYEVITKANDTEKHKILEACIICMEISCRKAGFKV